MDKEKLNTFIRLLQKCQRQPSQIFDLGLVVKESKSRISNEKIFNEIKKIVDIKRIICNKSSLDEEVIDKIVEAFSKNKWVFLEIKKDIGSPLLNQLKHLANHNSLQLLNYKGGDLSEIEMSKDSRVIVFAERDFIENKITYPHFYRLFGPTLSIK